MNRQLKKELRSAFDAPTPTRKTDFLNNLPYPRATNLEFFLSQVGYIRKRFWCLSVLVLVFMVLFAQRCEKGHEIVGLLSSTFPLLTLIAITEISKSISFNMAELEMSCKYNLSKITLIRLSVIGSFHFVILIASLLIFKSHTQYGILRYVLYGVTPFLLSSYLSFWITNHLKSKDPLYVCSGITGFISVIMFMMTTNFAMIYSNNFDVFWSITFIVISVLLVKELQKLLNERKELQWNFA